MKATELMTKAEYARHRGCAPSAVTKALKEGRISSIGGRINARLADLEWAENSRARADSGRQSSMLLAPANGQTGSSAPARSDDETAPLADGPINASTYAAARQRREVAEAERAELETAKAAGRLVDREHVLRGVHDEFRVLRDRVIGVSRSCAAELVGLVDQREIELVLAQELRRALGLVDGDEIEAASVPAIASIVAKVLV